MSNTRPLEAGSADGSAVSGQTQPHWAAVAADADPFAEIPLIDDTRLDRIRAMIPAAAFGVIVQSYIDSDFFAGLGEASPADDADFPGMVHDCKGTSANLGAARLRAIAEKLELACHTGDRGAISLLLPALRRVTLLTRHALAARVAGLPAQSAPGGDVRPLL